MTYPAPYRSRNAPERIYTYEDYPRDDWNYYPFFSEAFQEPINRQYKMESDTDDLTPRVLDLVGSGKSLKVSGHIDLLICLPLHHNMHRQLLETYRKKPGSYEGKYNDYRGSRAKVMDYGKGYLSIQFEDDLTQPEMSEFLLSKGWLLLNANCALVNGGPVVYEKWTNILDSNDSSKKKSIPAFYHQKVY